MRIILSLLLLTTFMLGNNGLTELTIFNHAEAAIDDIATVKALATKTLPPVTRSMFYWSSGETTDAFVFGLKPGWNYWIDAEKNPELAKKPHGSIFFAYVLGKDEHTSALVRAHTLKIQVNKQTITTFKFNVIQGLINKRDVLGDAHAHQDSKQIDYVTELVLPKQQDSDSFAIKTNAETLPVGWHEYDDSERKNQEVLCGHSKNKIPFFGDFYCGDWTFDFQVKEVPTDKWLYQHIVNHAPLPEGYLLAYIKGGNDNQELDWGAYCLLQVKNQKNVRFLILNDGRIDADADVYVNQVEIIKTLTNNSENLDNVFYQGYKDMFLLNSLEKKTDSDILAQYLPSHLLYSPEDYTWDPVRLRLVTTGSENPEPYVDPIYNAEGTLGKMFNERKTVDTRIPILFIHGWQGNNNDAFSILHEYAWEHLTESVKNSKTPATIKDSPSSGEAYWRNLMTYLFKDPSTDFAKKFKPYIYHYPSYKHVKFNARMLKELLDEIKDEVIRKAIHNNQLIIVGHSMGTIVSRSLMEEFGYLEHVEQFISLAGVHHGSPGAMASLIGSSAFSGKDLYTPGACDLIPDNYDGFIDEAIVDDIQGNLTSKELLRQRTICGSVFTRGMRYNTAKSSFDFFYLNALEVEDYYVNYGTDLPFLELVGSSVDIPFIDMAVPYHPNPWLLHLNKKHQDQYQELTKDKYYFYTGYVVAVSALTDKERFWIPNDSWSQSDWLVDDVVMDKIASHTVASQSNYRFIDSVVPIAYGIFDTSRGQVLKPNGELATYELASYQMPAELAIQTTPPLSNVSLQSSPILRGTNSWGAKSRIFGDYHHDRMLNGGYTDIYQFRNGKKDNGSAHNFFINYLVSIDGIIVATQQDVDHFKNEPLFVQIKKDIIHRKR